MAHCNNFTKFTILIHKLYNLFLAQTKSSRLKHRNQQSKPKPRGQGPQRPQWEKYQPSSPIKIATQTSMESVGINYFSSNCAKDDSPSTVIVCCQLTRQNERQQHNDNDRRVGFPQKRSTDLDLEPNPTPPPNTPLISFVLFFCFIYSLQSTTLNGEKPMISEPNNDVSPFFWASAPLIRIPLELERKKAQSRQKAGKAFITGPPRPSEFRSLRFFFPV